MKTCDHKFIDSHHCLKCGWAPPTSPVCSRCGSVMVDKFTYQKINEHAERAIPTDTYECLSYACLQRLR